MIEMEHVVELRQSVDELREEVHVLRMVIDELREVVEWISRNPESRADELQRLRRVDSMPLDPTCPDFGKRINAVSPDDHAMQDTQPPSRGPRTQQTFLSSEDDS